MTWDTFWTTVNTILEEWTIIRVALIVLFAVLARWVLLVAIHRVVAQYFDVLQTVWAERSYSIAEKLITGLYPSPLSNQALVDATRAWLDANPEPAALRRLVVENLAGVERSLRVQARDSE